jgi:hypothetical protein
LISGFRASTCIDVGTDAGNTLLFEEIETLDAIGSFALAWITEPTLCAIVGPPAELSISRMVGSSERE